VLIASNGASRHPAWYLNLRANPDAPGEVGERKVRVSAEEVDGEEKARVWQKMVEMYSGYDDYQEKTDRVIPLLVMHPSD
jgi:F420H(2)-dependent quinone reductase